MISLTSDITGVVKKLYITENQVISEGDVLIVVEAMKMETEIVSNYNARVSKVSAKEGELLEEGQLLCQVQLLEKGPNDTNRFKNTSSSALSESSCLQEFRYRKHLLTDEARPEAVKKRHYKGHLTARESIDLLIDKNSFREYGSMVIAAQRSRRSEEDLIKNTPADGLIAGTATMNSGPTNGRNNVLVMAYDYTVLAGTQGAFNHLKMDRMLEIAVKRKLPIVLLAEGGGGRPGDVDHQVIAGLHVMTFYKYAALAGVVPRIAVVTGYCFAGNAALAGSSDIIIATKSTSIGMGGPAMIEGGGLGAYHPSDIGPIRTQSKNGVIDIVADDDEQAMMLCRKVMAYFQGPTAPFTSANQNTLSDIIPSERRLVYQVRDIIKILCDTDSFIECKSDYARSVVTSFVTIGGHPFGLIANDCRREAGAITAAAAEKLAQFISLCDIHKLPVISLVDCPGIMVGPDAESQGTVRAAGRLFVAAAKASIPIYAVVLRRGFGLGAMAMTGGSFHATQSIVSWPTGQFGAMGIEGAVKLGFRKELESISDEEKRKKTYNKMVEELYHQGRAVNMASFLEIDEVIEPQETRSWILSQLD